MRNHSAVRFVLIDASSTSHGKKLDERHQPENITHLLPRVMFRDDFFASIQEPNFYGPHRTSKMSVPNAEWCSPAPPTRKIFVKNSDGSEKTTKFSGRAKHSPPRTPGATKRAIQGAKAATDEVELGRTNAAGALRKNETKPRLKLNFINPLSERRRRRRRGRNSGNLWVLVSSQLDRTSAHALLSDFIPLCN